MSGGASSMRPLAVLRISAQPGAQGAEVDAVRVLAHARQREPLGSTAEPIAIGAQADEHVDEAGGTDALQPGDDLLDPEPGPAGDGVGRIRSAWRVVSLM